MGSIGRLGSSVRRFAILGAGAMGLLAAVFVMTSGQATAQQATRTLGPNAGVVINPIKADMTSEYEMVMAKVKEALAQSEDAVRRQQAAGWRVYRAAEAGPNGAVLYLWIVDPAVRDADYTVSMILAEAFPAEVQDLYQTYSDAHAAGQTFINLTLATDFSQ